MPGAGLAREGEAGPGDVQHVGGTSMDGLDRVAAQLSRKPGRTVADTLAATRLKAIDRLLAPRPDDRRLLRSERVEEMAADVPGVHEDGALRGAATLGGEPDARAAAVGPVLGAFDEAAFLHACQLM
ncbi:hypothetical protein [Streptomyces aurantiacus]|uniref:hypothetical protein n=1 Tax=Streptomyces aurantiacus TaxID=47760 RepID=UPI0027D81189|nr:hypothetical protein [Streptomyces aurantiacus]